MSRKSANRVPANERVLQSRQRQRQAGFKRVEVLVPAHQVDQLKAYVAQLRHGSDSEAISNLRKLVASAYRRFYASCLDNISVDPERAEFADGAVVAAALMHRGNAEAYKLGREIRSLIK